MTGSSDKDQPRGAERRQSTRFAVRDVRVDLQSDQNFLFAYVENISEMGIFLASDKPLPKGSRLTLKFPPRSGAEALTLTGTVRWVNPPTAREPGMGISFEGLTPALRERVVELVRAIAYLTKGS